MISFYPKYQSVICIILSSVVLHLFRISCRALHLMWGIWQLLWLDNRCFHGLLCPHRMSMSAPLCPQLAFCGRLDWTSFLVALGLNTWVLAAFPRIERKTLCSKKRTPLSLVWFLWLWLKLSLRESWHWALLRCPKVCESSLNLSIYSEIALYHP